MDKITYEMFIDIFELLPNGSEFEFYFSHTKETYSLVKYENMVDFCRCGYSEEMIAAGWPDWRGSEPEEFASFEELYVATVVDDICLKHDWNKITNIGVNNSLSLPEQIDELYELYGFDKKAL